MNTAIENRIIEFVKDVILSNSTDKSIRERALSIYTDYYRETGMVKISDCQPAARDFWLKKEDYDNIQRFILNSQKIVAIKELRAITNWGLKQSKEAVESAVNFEQPAPQKW